MSRNVQWVAHKKHLRAVRAWHRETSGQDWRLIKVKQYRDRPWRYRYLWVGPDGSQAHRVLLGTDQSEWFLNGLKRTLQRYRMDLAQRLHQPADPRLAISESPSITAVPIPADKPIPNPFPNLPPVVGGEVLMDEDELEKLDHTV